MSTLITRGAVMWGLPRTLRKNRVGIMVTHDLRMIGYVDKIISMIDGRIDLITDDCSVIEAMAGTVTPPAKIETAATPSGIVQT